MSKVYDSTKLRAPYHAISQTPANYSIKDYWYKETQDKVDADWNYRPNRALIEREETFGTETFNPLEVVIQTIKNDTGTIISDDWRRLVFRDTRYQCPLGLKFRFSYNFDVNENDLNKSIWLASNRNTASPTASIVVVRCNGTLGSEYQDDKGITRYHYEPVVQTKDLKSVNLFYNETAVGQQSDLVAIVQHNKYTKNYYVNQRFVVGYDRVYRIEAISKFASLKTYDPMDLGTIILYLKIVETSEYDNFDTRIAYNNKERIIIDTNGDEESYNLRLLLPEVIPELLTADPITFKPRLYHGDIEILDSSIKTTIQLMNASETPTPVAVNVMERYVNIVAAEHTIVEDTYTIENTDTFTLSKLRFYPAGDLVVTFSTTTTTGKEVILSLNLALRGV